MPWRSSRARDSKPENKPLVVALTVLQLSLVVLVWLLAILPAALLALAALVRQALRSARPKK